MNTLRDMILNLPLKSLITTPSYKLVGDKTIVDTIRPWRQRVEALNIPTGVLWKGDVAEQTILDASTESRRVATAKATMRRAGRGRGRGGRRGPGKSSGSDIGAQADAPVAIDAVAATIVAKDDLMDAIWLENEPASEPRSVETNQSWDQANLKPTILKQSVVRSSICGNNPL